MLTWYGHKRRLPQSDMAYVGLRLAALDTLCQTDACHGSGDDYISGRLAQLPILEQVAGGAGDLLAGVWRRQQAAAFHRASLLDAAAS
jgi:hypothetical protein